MTIPTADSWQILFNTSTASDPAEMFNDLTEVGRGELAVERIPDHVETLTMRFERPSAVQLVIEWENTRVRVPIEILD